MKNNDIVFSIIIPAYNCKDYIFGCLKSIYAQTFKKYKIIIVDDGSDEYISSYIPENDKLNIIRIENSGPLIARIIGVEDSDDALYSENCLAVINELLVKIILQISFILKKQTDLNLMILLMMNQLITKIVILKNTVFHIMVFF